MKYDYLLHHVFLRSLEQQPLKPSVADNRTILTFRELAEKAGGLADLLQQIGIKRGDRVAFFLDHDTHQAVTILAISVAGGAFVPINALLLPQQVEHILRDSGARVLITTEARHQSIVEIIPKCSDIVEVIHVEDLPDNGTLRRTYYGIENDLAAILYTSGPSGLPKGVMISHKNLIAGCWIISDYLDLRPTDRLLGILPLSFDYGLNQMITMWA